MKELIELLEKIDDMKEIVKLLVECDKEKLELIIKILEKLDEINKYKVRILPIPYPQPTEPLPPHLPPYRITWIQDGTSTVSPPDISDKLITTYETGESHNGS